MNKLCSLIHSSLTRFVERLEVAAADKHVMCLGVTVPDGLHAVVGRYLVDGDLAAPIDSYQRLSPVEWPRSQEEPFLKPMVL
jgi:hypothetical protein